MNPTSGTRQSIVRVVGEVAAARDAEAGECGRRRTRLLRIVEDRYDQARRIEGVSEILNRSHAHVRRDGGARETLRESIVRLRDDGAIAERLASEAAVRV